MAQVSTPTSESRVLPLFQSVPAIIRDYLGALANRIIWKTPPPNKLSQEEQEILDAARKIDSQLFQRIDLAPMVDEDAKDSSTVACGVEAMEIFAESEPDIQLVSVQTKSGELEVSRGLLRDLRNKNRDLWKHRISGSIRNPVEDEAAVVEELYVMADENPGLLRKVTFFANQNLAIRIRHSITGKFFVENGVTPMFDPLTPCEIDIDRIKNGIVRVSCAYNGAIKKVSYPNGDADILEIPITFRSLGSFVLGSNDEDDTSEITVQLK